ncbi:uncharacterized protein L201_000545 [Kwoniella dendrophila CBS 6074]|uniref:GmrSD restriction endonucleases N-terminal domain-containing protein n=1 Tax=Kwoniella dendrophila CBS 6074 TaxID=1295534 RepID=A0AAX4JJU0_9TREE
MPPKKTNQTAAGNLSDDSDLDDFFDELEDDEQDRKPKKKGPPESIDEILKGRIGKPYNVNLSTKTLHDMIHTGRVELEPDYQRDVVWTELKMIGLIQSLFMNFYVPPLIFAVQPNKQDGQTEHVCIDGKQRCTSIINFMDGKIPFISPHTKERYWYNKYSTHKGKQLPRELKSQFDLIQLAAVEYHDSTEDQQRDIFQRVQLGVQLSAAEKLQAHAGPYAKWIGELEKRYITAEGTLGGLLNWVMNRGRPFQNLLGSIALCRESTNSKIFAPSAAALRAFVERGDAPDQDYKNRCNMAFSIFVNIATNYFDLAFKTTTTTRIAPVEFWFSTYLIYSRMGFLSVRALAEEIGAMRAMIRKHVPGNVSANGLVFGLLSTQIQSIPKKRKLNEIPAAEQYEGDDDVDERNARAMKRSRRAEEDDPTYTEEWTERALASPTRTTTRAKATTTTTAAVHNKSSASNTPARLSPVAAAQTQVQARPAPVNVDAAQRPIAGLPTPRSATSTVQPPQNQQVYNQQPAVNNQQSANAQPGIGNTSQQWREYTEARVKKQYPESFQPQPQSQQQQQQPQQSYTQTAQQHQYYGR